MNQLTKVIEDLVAEKTFSLDAVEVIKQIKDKAAQLERELEREKSQKMEFFDLLTSSQKSGADLALQLKEAHQEIKALKENLHAAHKVEAEGKEAKAELKGFMGAMQMVFRPSVVRESFQKRVPVPVEGNPGGNGVYGTAGFVVESSESGTIERSAE